MKALLMVIGVYGAVIGLACGGALIVRATQARDLDELVNRPKNHLATTWYPEHRVFCATRLNAVDCVFIPLSDGWDRRNKKLK